MLFQRILFQKHIIFVATIIVLLLLTPVGNAQVTGNNPAIPSPNIRPSMVFTESYYKSGGDKKLELLDRYESALDETTPGRTRYAFIQERIKLYEDLGRPDDAAELAFEASFNIDKFRVPKAANFKFLMRNISTSLYLGKIENAYLILERMRDVDPNSETDELTNFYLESGLNEISIFIGDYESAAENLTETFEKYRSTFLKNDTPARVQTLGNIVHAHLQTGNAERAFYYLDLFEKEMGDIEKIPGYSARNARWNLHNQSNRTQGLLIDGQLEEARRLGEDLLRKSVRLKQDRFKIWAEAMLGVIAQRDGAPEQAVQYFSPVDEWVSKTGDAQLVTEFYQDYADAFNAIGQFERAFDVLTLFHEKHDEVLALQVSGRMAMLEHDMEKVKAQQKIVKLEQENTHQREITSWHERVRKLLILIVLSLSFVAIVAIVSLYMQKRIAKKLRAARKQALDANRIAQSEARIDQMTRIGNRRAFYEYCSDFPDTRCEDQTYTLALLDLDKFKSINDTLGHEAGDLTIQQTAQRLERALLGIGQVFRLGGDEFAIVFYGEDDEKLSQFETCIASALKDPIQTHSDSFSVHWSVGAIRVPNQSSDLQSFMSLADHALYQAKENPGSGLYIFSDSDAANIESETYFSEEVVWNLETSDFVMFGQLIVKTTNSAYQVFGVEGLLRAQTRSGQVIPPETFIRHAINTGQSARLTQLSLSKSIEMLRESELECALFFNLSKEQLANNNLLQIVKNTLNATNFPANQLVIELSEHMLRHDFSSATETLKALKRLGVRIALDDFGSANTGFSTLHDFDFDIIKTDMKLLDSAMSFQRSKDLLSSLIGLCQKFRVDCIIEGLETPAQVAFAKSLGGQVFQGYVFGRPEETPRLRSYIKHSDAKGLDALPMIAELREKIA